MYRFYKTLASFIKFAKQFRILKRNLIQKEKLAYIKSIRIPWTEEQCSDYLHPYTKCKTQQCAQQCAEQVKVSISQCQLHQRLCAYIFNGQGCSVTVISTSVLCQPLQYVVVSSYCLEPM